MKKVNIFFFPHIAGGHLLPMVDAARFVASHPNVRVTLITTTRNAQLFQNAIDRDRDIGRDISFYVMDLPKAGYGLPDDAENLLGSATPEIRYKIFLSILSLKEPLLELLKAQRPDCLVSDVVQSWTLDVANKAGVPRVGFRVTSVFASCVDDCLNKFKPHEKVSSDDEPFVIPGLPDPIQMTRKRMTLCQSDQNVVSFFNEVHQAERDSYGVIANTSYDLEPDYHNYAKKVMGVKLWAIGPVSKFSNKNVLDKSERGSGKNHQDGELALKWLESKARNSVVYVSFGSEGILCKEQFQEIALGLEASGHSFIWLAKSTLYIDQNEPRWFPEGFEERMRDSNQGLIIKGWAPQLLILDHANVGAFMTHCGWNSSIEGLCAGLPLVTYPLAVDQFNNECLLVDVMKVGIRVGNEQTTYLSKTINANVNVRRDKVEVAVRRILGSEQVVQEMRQRARFFSDKCAKTIEPGGSSHNEIYAFVDDLIARRNKINSQGYN